MTPSSPNAAIDAEIDRLCRIMAAWWQGDSLGTIANAHCISRQRVHTILKRVGCSADLRKTAIQAPEPRTRMARDLDVAAARMCLLHPSAWRLTPRQRGALAWMAQGLNTITTGYRMGIEPPAVASLLYQARRRLQQWGDARTPGAAARKSKKGRGDGASGEANTAAGDDWATWLNGLVIPEDLLPPSQPS